MLDAERLDFETHNPRKIGFDISVVQDGKAQMVVQEEAAVILRSSGKVGGMGLFDCR